MATRNHRTVVDANGHTALLYESDRGPRCSECTIEYPEESCPHRIGDRADLVTIAGMDAHFVAQAAETILNDIRTALRHGAVPGTDEARQSLIRLRAAFAPK